ncbi:glycosyltransferase involved in cell wall biosynthesis [Lewinella marina]|uniref:Glycosyltransferase 2-like domain-containing protein n=1 Tax=Neolewinella marina TaxID=438751 RepID=A0A2G0CHD7_9BACT|nr:glycosyltransferase family 2 protein [Neolewinella marina]NJB86141.1 glycosyltransferase involved in cell wall biosynthesis [Neolewinella marina]PHK99381.1 hypothetical protein CGL56_07985 [Neolewinella marina]
MQLTVIICTYARESLLENSLKTLCKQTIDRSHYGIVVVDNACRPETQQVVEKYGAQYVMEPKIGHSVARNRGMQVTRSPWALYLDDDIQAPVDLIEKFLARIVTAHYAALGGEVRHWFLTTPPRWLVRYYNKPYRPVGQTEYGELKGEEYLIGCLIAVRKSAWEAVGGFSDSVGMHGKEVGRGDEDEFQLRLRAANYKIYYDPEIYIDHLVQPYKYTLKGQLQLAYASGRDGIGMRGNHVLSLWELFLRLALITGYSVPFNVARVLFKPGYYWQNGIVDCLTKYYFAWGEFFPHRYSKR